MPKSTARHDDKHKPSLTSVGGGTENAFSLLMANKKRQRPVSRQTTSSTRNKSCFVLCPVGCGQHVAEKDINTHIDHCLVVQQKTLERSKQQDERTSKAKDESFVQQSTESSFRPNSDNRNEKQSSTQSDTLVMEQEGKIEATRVTAIPSTTKPELPTTPPKLSSSTMMNQDSPVVVTQEKAHVDRETVVDPMEAALLAEQDTCTESPTSPAACVDGQTMVESDPREKDAALFEQVHDNTESPASPAAAANVHQQTMVECETTREIETEQVHGDNAESPKAPPAAARNEPLNAFARMMSQSKTVFSSQTPRKQCFHLNENGSISLFMDRNHPGEEATIAWSTTLKVKDRAAAASNNDISTPVQQMEVTVSSSIPSQIENTRTRFVRHHSRLSVPVLKSVLQKSIRRRLPLPSVRVAMELADKSLSDLLRRLPVIILEDSTLHPDYGLLVWLMVAHSKDYVIPNRLLERVLEMVFEIASCPWSDPIHDLEQQQDDNDTNSGPLLPQLCSFNSLMEHCNSLSTTDTHTVDYTLLWSILVRAEYGGMKGDVIMLRKYANLWMQRFLGRQAVPLHVLVLTQTSNTNKEAAGDSKAKLTWFRVPLIVHERARKLAKNQVTPLLHTGLDHLGLQHVCLQGVDFHCSAIVDALLSDPSFCELCLDLLSLSNERNDDQQSRRSELESILKRCIWEYSSGVNRRRPLLTVSSTATTTSAYKEFWNELVAPRAAAYQKAYIEQRLVKE